MADSDRYSDGYQPVEESSLPEEVRDAIRELADTYGTVRTVQWADGFVALVLELRIDLPTGGPVGDVDIREVEPAMVVVNTRTYPRAAPMARSDRRSFPVDQLPHLNPVKAEHPPWMCLHRGSIDDWFAEHSIVDFVERMRGWYRDAGMGRLMREGDVFEPTRLVEPSGYMIFTATELDRRLREIWAQSAEPGYRFAGGETGGDTRARTGWRVGTAISLDPFLYFEPHERLVAAFRNLNAATEGMKEYPRQTFAIVGWTSSEPVGAYFGRIPSTFGELAAFAEQLNIPLRAAIAELEAARGWLLKGLPILLGISRPRPLQGSGSTIEWLCFMVVTDELADTDPVYSLAQREPLTTEFARALSNVAKVERLERPLILGCGAIGSKVSLHLAKAGFVAQRLVDWAILTPHHVVRHGLLGEHVGIAKSEGLKKAIVALFPGGGDLGVEHSTQWSHEVLRTPEKLEDRTILIDATASSAVQDDLVGSDLPLKLKVCRIEIASEELGLLTYEGTDRNPRLDDLQLEVFDMGRSHQAISAWLRAHRDAKDEPRFEDIGLGLGCSSNTFRIADDTVSLHAAAFSRGLRQIAASDRGHVMVVTDAGTRSVTIPPVSILPVDERPGWTVRLSARAVSTMQSFIDRHRFKESGGLLIGFVHLKRKIVYVSDALPPSRDSSGTPNRFVRGTDGYLKQTKAIADATGGMLGCVGEWHTHPRGSTAPSPIDREALAGIQKVLDAADLPAVIVIVGPTSMTAAMHALGTT